jgi:hypothetical protein
MSMKHKAFSSDITVIEGERAVSAVISTTAVDRDCEVLLAAGANWKDFSANPVCFWDHAYCQYDAEMSEKLPIGQCVAIKRDSDSISFKMTFAERPAAHPAGEEWLPDTLLSLYQQGVMRAFSVGFIPIEIRNATDKDLITFGADCRRVISKWKLLEVSAVALPANQEAVALAVSKGLITRDGAKSIFGKAGEVTDEQIAAAAPADVTAPAQAEQSPESQGEVTDNNANKPGEQPAGDAPADTASEESAPEAESPPAEDATPTKRIHRRVLKSNASVTIQKTIIRREIRNEIRKARGAIYAD